MILCGIDLGIIAEEAAAKVAAKHHRPPHPNGICPICKERHITEEDKERARRGGNSTAVILALCRQDMLHWRHDQKLKSTPPEYVI